MICDDSRRPMENALSAECRGGRIVMSSMWRQAALRVGFIVAVAAVFVIQTPQLLAQTSNAQLSGSVTDTSGAVVAGAEIKAVNTATNVAYAAVSNGSGIYILQELSLIHISE